MLLGPAMVLITVWELSVPISTRLSRDPPFSISQNVEVAKAIPAYDALPVSKASFGDVGSEAGVVLVESETVDAESAAVEGIVKTAVESPKLRMFEVSIAPSAARLGMSNPWLFVVLLKPGKSGTVERVAVALVSTVMVGMVKVSATYGEALRSSEIVGA